MRLHRYDPSGKPQRHLIEINSLIRWIESDEGQPESGSDVGESWEYIEKGKIVAFLNNLFDEKEKT